MSDAGSKLQAWFAELRRRKVIRVAAVYLVAAWLLIQVADAVFEPMGLPPWSLKLVIVLAALGFPLACVLAWAFDVTPRGIERAETAALSAAEAPAERPSLADAGAAARAGPRHGAGADRVGRDPAIRRHEPGARPGVLLRRHRRGDHQRAVLHAEPARGVAHLVVPVQGSCRRYPRDRPRAGRGLGARRQRTQGGQPRAHHDAARQHGGRLPPVVGELRPRPRRRLRAAGGDRAADAQGAQAQPRPARDGDARARRHDQRRGLRPLPARPVAHALRDEQPSGGGPVPSRARAGSQVRPGPRRDRERHRAARHVAR